MNCIKSFLVAACKRYEDFKTIRHLERRRALAGEGIHLYPLLNSEIYLPATPDEARIIVADCTRAINTIHSKYQPQIS